MIYKTLHNNVKEGSISNVPEKKIGQKVTYKDIKDHSAEYCAQCVITGGKWTLKVNVEGVS